MVYNVKLSEIDPTCITAPKLDLKKSEEKYAAKPTAFIGMSDLKYNDKSFEIEITGELDSDGVIVNAEYASHSIKVMLDDESAKNINEIMAKILIDPAFEVNNFIDEDNCLYLKLKYKRDKSKYLFKCNKPMFPKNPSAVDLSSGETVTATGKIAIYHNFADNNCGISFKIKNLLV